MTDLPSAAGRVCVMVRASAPAGDPAAVEKAYHEVSQALEGTSGLIGNVLLRCVDEPGSFVVLSEWQDLDAFRSWENGDDHRAATAPLRPLQARDGRKPFGIYQVTASY
jgi:heme-degrading monooxygenase HmoA